MRYPSFIPVLFFSAALQLCAQEFEWQAGIDGFLDNREYYSIGIPKTMFGSRVHGQVGASLPGGHRFMAGINYLVEFGDGPVAHLPDVTAYYRYRSAHAEFLFGAFPRSGFLEYPLVMLSDTLNYYRPNIQGAGFRVHGKWGNQKVFIDWTSRQSDTRPERFVFGFSGRVRSGPVYLDHYFLMGHFAGTAIPDPDFHLRDNGGFLVDLGIDLSQKIFLDSLDIGIGGVVSLDRIRGVYKGWQTPAGFRARLVAIYKWLGIEGTFYSGQGQPFLYGDPFYRLRHYSRLDFFVMPFGPGAVSLKFDVGLHFARGQVDYSQQILVSMALDGGKNGE